jgi:ketosteroid isomerase-like protein
MLPSENTRLAQKENAVKLNCREPRWRVRPMSAQTSPPSFAQIIQQWQTAANKKDAASIAALYTADTPTKAVLIISQGPFSGQSEIQQALQGQFTAGWSGITVTDDEDHSQGNWAWSTGTWSSNVPKANGWWSVIWVQESTGWKIQQHSVVQYQSQ